MTSNSPENSNPAERGARRPSTPEPAAGGAGAPGAPQRGTEPAGRPSVQGERTPASGTNRTSTPASPPSGRKPTATKKQSTSSGRTADKGGARGSGGDWNVFRTVVVLVGLGIAAFGVYYLVLGTQGLPDTDGAPVNATLENQFRFFSAVTVGVGAAFITIAIKFQWVNMLWLVCLMVFVGGIGRVLSWAFSGTPNYLMIILMVVELAFPPALLVWHKYIAKTTELRQEYADRG